MATTNCPKCGAANELPARFCRYCRAPLDGTGETQAALAANTPAAAWPNTDPASAAVQLPNYAATQSFAPPPRDNVVTDAYQAQTGEPAKKKRSPLKIVLIVVGALLACCIVGAVATFAVASCSTGQVAEAEEYEIGPDKVPSVKKVLGKTYTVTGYATSNNGGLQTVDIAFSTDGRANEEMQQYCHYLSRNGWLRTQDADFGQTANPKSRQAGFQLAKNSSESGFVVVVTVYWEADGFNLVIDRTEGDVGSDDVPQEDTPAPSIFGGGSSGSDESASGTDTDDLWAPVYFQVFESGHYAMGLSIKASNTSTSGNDSMTASTSQDLEVYVDGDRQAMSMTVGGRELRSVFMNGKQYIIDDASRTVVVTGSEPLEMVSDTSGVTFVSAGTDAFMGTEMYCEVWDSPSGNRSKWFFDTENEWIEGYAFTAEDGTYNEIYVAWLELDFDESVFNVPADYQQIQG